MPVKILPFASVLLVLLLPAGITAQQDIVLRGGRVMDPASGLDSVMNVGITGGRIEAITSAPLDGAEVIDVSGLVVAPGFIDLHAHGQDPFSRDLQARDGVTTALNLEGGPRSVEQWYALRAGDWRINYGTSAGYNEARRRVFDDNRDSSLYEPAEQEQIERIQSILRQELAHGALGIGMGLQYAPGASREEVFRIFETAAEAGVTVFSHIRYAGLVEPESSIAAVQEMIADAAGSGGSVHIVHIGSSGLEQVPLLLSMIRQARAEGVDVTTEVYPYSAASTRIQAAIFDEGWRERLGGDYEDIEWIATGERLDSLSFHRRREEGGMIIAHVIPENAVDQAVAAPDVIIASDGGSFRDGRAHPRGAGTFARVLGRYVRERGSLSLMEALRKMTLLPAQRLEDAVPAMRTKGRVVVGADADLTIFDPGTVIDRATFADPAQPSEGIAHVMVNGVFVVRDGVLVEGVFPGRAIRRSVSADGATLPGRRSEAQGRIGDQLDSLFRDYDEGPD